MLTSPDEQKKIQTYTLVKILYISIFVAVQWG